MLSNWKVLSIILTMAEEDMIKYSSISEVYRAVMNGFPLFNARIL